MGQYSVCDCVLFREGKVYLVEVKATKEPKFYRRAKIKTQLEKMTAIAKNSNVGAILAVKFKYKGWVEEILVWKYKIELLLSSFSIQSVGKLRPQSFWITNQFDRRETKCPKDRGVQIFCFFFLKKENREGFYFWFFF